MKTLANAPQRGGGSTQKNKKRGPGEVLRYANRKRGRVVTLFKGKSVAGMGFKSRIPALHPLRISTKNPVQSFLQQKVITLETLTSLSYHSRRTSTKRGQAFPLWGENGTAGANRGICSCPLFGPGHLPFPWTARPFKGSYLYAAASKQPADSSSGCLVNKAHAIAVQEASPSGRS